MLTFIYLLYSISNNDSATIEGYHPKSLESSEYQTEAVLSRPKGIIENVKFM